MTEICDDREFPFVNPEVYTTKKGTPYLRECGVALIAKPSFNVGAVAPFLRSFGDLFDADDYCDDDAFAEETGSDGEQLVKTAGQICYLSFGENRTRNKDTKKYLTNIKSSGHGSVLEHANYSMLFWGIDRAVTHELVRHRAGFGFSQVSQRYVDGKALRFVEDAEYQDHEQLHSHFEQCIDSAVSDYNHRAELLMTAMADKLAALSKTDRRKKVNQSARRRLPNETEAPTVVTANVRAWRNFFDQRGTEHADTPIRRLAVRTYLIIKSVAPILFDDYAYNGECLTTPYRKV